MLKSIDMLIGLAVVLLALSMGVTVMTQCITTVINTRGRHLRRGLVDLLQQLDPHLTPAVSQSIANAILTHPLVSGSRAPFASKPGEGTRAWLTGGIRRLAGGPRLGNVVHRDEFTKLLMAAACGQGVPHLAESAKTALAAALANNGVEDPATALKHIRILALQLERSSPELANVARQNLAIVRAAESDFVAKVNNWFDQTMDRTSQRFTASTRAITFLGALIVAFGLQVDTPTLVNRLAADDELRAAFVQGAEELYAAEQKGRTEAQAEAAASGAGRNAAAPLPAATQAAGPNDAGTPSGPASPAGTAAQSTGIADAPGPTAAGTTTPGARLTPARRPTDAADIGREYQAFLAEHGIITLPTGGSWMQGYREMDPFDVLGILLTALLLSLGAPFWYNALGRLLQLRSVLAAKDDVQRTARQINDRQLEATAGATAATAGVRGISGERGDLAAIG